jgi:N4-gp56 family major capsid protein
MAGTFLMDLIDPQVMAQMISAKLPKKIRFSPLARIDNTLVGRPGSTLTVPKYKYTGEAKVVAEGEAIDITKLETVTEEFTIQKAGTGKSITDEAILSGLGNPVGEAENQMLLSIADKIDSDCLAAMATTTLKFPADKWDVDTVSDALDLFDDEDNYQTVLVMNNKDASKLRKAVGGEWEKASDLGDGVIVNGTYGAVLGCQIVRSKKLAEGKAYLVKVGSQSTNEFDDPDSGALAIYYKRNVDVEADRDIIKKISVMTADAHYGVYLYDETKCVEITVS